MLTAGHPFGQTAAEAAVFIPGAGALAQGGRECAVRGKPGGRGCRPIAGVPPLWW